MAYRIAVCDDEKVILKSISTKIRQMFESKDAAVEVNEFTGGEELYENDEIASYDALFLDIDMPGVNGIEAAQSLRKFSRKLLIVFVTNKDDMVFESIKCEPFRFVRKNRLDEELEEAVNAVIHKIYVDNMTVELPASRGMLCVKLEDVECFTSVKHQVFAVTTGENIMLNTTMKQLEEKFSQNGFIRVHSSYLVNYRYVYTINKDSVVMDNGNSIPVSRHRLNEVKKKLHYFIRKW